ncbi:Skp1 family, dimerization domain-containing protein [Chaetomium tenue]|uniref:Skp1 family, dimerization domain-containing protein n=1 Tax=Chaetomium tenue TaxID=1854479 RepID=A0ACB7NXS6_9PEZI|nr:Skp1 family, dimerization domain-containing protein [Chaetomium globosum]
MSLAVPRTTWHVEIAWVITYVSQAPRLFKFKGPESEGALTPPAHKAINTGKMSEFVNVQNNITDEEGNVLSQGKIFTIPREAAEHSGVFRQLFEDFASLEKDVDFSKEVIPFCREDVTDNSVSKVIEWLTKYKDLRKPNDEESGNRDGSRITLTDWEKEYFHNLSEKELFDFLVLTHYLEMDLPKQRGCQYVASLISGKPAPVIREIFGIVNDFSPEDQTRIEKENAWASGKERA